MASKESPTPRSRDPSPAASKRSSEAGPPTRLGPGGHRPGGGDLVATDNPLPEIKKYVRQQVVTETVGLESPSKGVPTLQLKVFHEGQSMALSDAMRHRPSGVYFCQEPTAKATGLDQIALQCRPCLHQTADRAALRHRHRSGHTGPKGLVLCTVLALQRPCSSGQRHCLLHRSLHGDAPQLARPDRLL